MYVVGLILTLNLKQSSLLPVVCATWDQLKLPKGEISLSSVLFNYLCWLQNNIEQNPNQETSFLNVPIPRSYYMWDKFQFPFMGYHVHKVFYMWTLLTLNDLWTEPRMIGIKWMWKYDIPWMWKYDIPWIIKDTRHVYKIFVVVMWPLLTSNVFGHDQK